MARLPMVDLDQVAEKHPEAFNELMANSGGRLSGPY